MGLEAGERRLHRAAAEDVSGAQKEASIFGLATQELVEAGRGRSCGPWGLWAQVEVDEMERPDLVEAIFNTLRRSSKLYSPELRIFAEQTGFEGDQEDAKK